MKIKKNKKYIIAEIGINHEGDYKIAKKLIINAARAGADAVKFQLFKPKTLAGFHTKKTSDQYKNTIKSVADVTLTPSGMAKLSVFAFIT